MITKEDILHFLAENKEYIQKKFHVVRIGLFGSFARDMAGDESDIDIILEFEEGVSDIFETKHRLKEYIAHNLNHNVDLCREKYIKPHVKDEILSEALYV